MRTKIQNYPLGYAEGLYLPTLSMQARDGLDILQPSVFGDIRRQKSFDWLYKRLEKSQSCNISKVTRTESERKRAERFINNDHVSASQVIESCCLPVGYLGEGQPVVLNIADESVLTFADAVGRMKGKEVELGRVGNGFHFGQNSVVGLSVGWPRCNVMGIHSLSFHSQGIGAVTSRKRIGRNNRPLRYRSTSKWLHNVREAQKRVGPNARLINVIDREADSFDFLAQFFSKEQAPDLADPHLVIRCRTNRSVKDVDNQQCKGRILSLLAKQSVLGHYQVQIKHDERISFSATYQGPQKGCHIKRVVKRQGRVATLEVRYVKVRLDLASIQKTKSHMPKQMVDQLIDQTDLDERILTYIQVREVKQKSVKRAATQSKQKINWLLLTSLPINNEEDVFEVIAMYRQRFPLIEQLFRCVKTDGFDVEKAQFKSLKTLQIISAMAYKASAQTMAMIQARDEDQGFDINDYFTEYEVQALELCLTDYEGNTSIQINPHPKDQLSWAAWIIARIGGWKPENKQRKPGPKTFQRGLESFRSIYYGMALIRGWPVDVSQP